MLPSQKSKDPQKALLQHANILISRKDFFTSEIKDKLIQKCKSLGVSFSLVDQIITKLISEGYLDDQRTARTLINSSLHKFQGPRKIYQKLLVRKLSSQEAKQIISTIENEAIISSAQEYVAKHSRLSPQKLITRLQYRGFSYSHFYKLFDVDLPTD